MNVNFPFLDFHPAKNGHFTTNARMTQTFDQIGLFSRDPRLTTYQDNATMGKDPRDRTMEFSSSSGYSVMHCWVKISKV